MELDEFSGTLQWPRLKELQAYGWAYSADANILRLLK